jgi:hypothetical protein
MRGVPLLTSSQRRRGVAELHRGCEAQSLIDQDLTVGLAASLAIFPCSMAGIKPPRRPRIVSETSPGLPRLHLFAPPGPTADIDGYQRRVLVPSSCSREDLFVVLEVPLQRLAQFWPVDVIAVSPHVEIPQTSAHPIRSGVASPRMRSASWTSTARACGCLEWRHL